MFLLKHMFPKYTKHPVLGEKGDCDKGAAPFNVTTLHLLFFTIGW